MAHRLRTVHTADLGPAERSAVRALLDEAFAGQCGDDDWDHALGGVHALVEQDGRVLAHGSVVQRVLLHGGRALRCGYVEGVAVAPSARRQGLAGQVLAALEGVIARAYDLGALSATDEAVALYEGRGWQPWRGPTAVLAPEGLLPTPGEAPHVLVGAAALDLDGLLACDPREGDPW